MITIREGWFFETITTLLAAVEVMGLLTISRAAISNEAKNALSMRQWLNFMALERLKKDGTKMVCERTLDPFKKTNCSFALLNQLKTGMNPYFWLIISVRNTLIPCCTPCWAT